MATATLQVRTKMQLHSVSYGKTRARKDVATKPDEGTDNKEEEEEEEFSSKAQITTLMTTDVDRAAGTTVTWAQDRTSSSSASSGATIPAASTSVASTPTYSTLSTPGSGNKFIPWDVSVRFPPRELSLVCGKLGSRKTLLLLPPLGEVDLLAEQVVVPGGRVDGAGYVPRAAWLRNASVNLPLDEARYQKSLDACALVTDWEILEARVSLARVVYSRTSTLFLDDVLSAVDIHTAPHLYLACPKSKRMRGRTIVLVPHYVQLCAPGASYVVALDNGCVQFAGSGAEFRASGVMDGVVQSGRADGDRDDDVEEAAEKELGGGSGSRSESESEASDAVDVKTAQQAQKPKKAPRKLVEEEARAVGHISRDIWRTCILACGGAWFWVIFAVILVVAAMCPVAENWWLKCWAGLLESILFANIRFHDTVSRSHVLIVWL
ncbi:hypothetical protein FIBSPDRAFT_950636 [Athelia psychrophila]|uniref:ABC transporter domain-containing protein n=1 Tax=Athelia psychrophila TaxID=1759441 RepID=A0A166NEC9_9AGAM|nr:hypothetical protein FIBSPDRAFT_950636 [Fibularhizoctonia sp. CBS 109695]